MQIKYLLNLKKKQPKKISGAKNNQKKKYVNPLNDCLPNFLTTETMFTDKIMK